VVIAWGVKTNDGKGVERYTCASSSNQNKGTAKSSIAVFKDEIDANGNVMKPVEPTLWKTQAFVDGGAP
jgi:hypothetical protein